MTPPEPPREDPAPPAAAGDLGEAGPPTLSVQLTVWTHGRWQARADWGDGHWRLFDSPFELARFVAHPPTRTTAGSGLR